MASPFGRASGNSSSSDFCIPRQRRSRIVMVAVVAVLLAIGLAVAAVAAYFGALAPVDSNASGTVRVVVQTGQTASQIAVNLKDSGLIRSKEAFELYTQLSGTKTSLRAGGYLLRKSQSVQEIVDHLITGKSDEMNVTILPGLTIEQLADPAVPGSLAQQGFTSAEIKSALNKSYGSPLLTGKPAGTSLEGYIYPETYRIAADGTLETVFEMTFTEFYRVIQKNNIEAGLKAHNLSLYQGITLASIVQKEVSHAADQPQVAQVFLSRLDKGMMLGSDVTFLYIAKKEGRTPSVNDPSPYNTRKNPGLPPGPIANFNLTALQAVVAPAPGDYLYFVAGDDGTTHYARTEAEHNANVAAYCHVLCSE